jgi:hypothetical protein
MGRAYNQNGKKVEVLLTFKQVKIQENNFMKA